MWTARRRSPRRGGQAAANRILVASFAVALLLCPLIAQAQTQVLIINQTLVDNQFIFGRNAASPPSLTQRVLNSTNPSLLGLTPADSIIRFPADGSVTGQAVTAQSFGAGTPAALVSGLTIDGQYAVGQSTPPSTPFVANGVELINQAARIEGCFIKGFRGAGAVVGPESFVRNNQILSCLTGVKVASSDTMVTGNWVAGIRDYGLHLAGTPGNTYSSGNHFFGCNNSDGIGAACKIDGGATLLHAVGDTYADSSHGIQAGGSQHQFTGCHIQHCWVRGVEFTAIGAELHGCIVNGMLRTDEYPNTVAVEFAGARSAMFDGDLHLSPYMGNGQLHNGVASEGLWISADSCRARTRLIDGDGKNGTIGVRVKNPIIGGEFHFWCYDFHQSNDRLLVVDNAAVDNTNSAGTTGMRGVTFHFWGMPTPKTGNITNVTKVSGQPIVITAAGHWVITGDRVTIANVMGFGAANGTWTATKIDGTSFSLNGTEAASGSYTSGGTWTTSENIDLTNPGDESAGVKKYVDIKADWHSSNVIVLHNTATGGSVTLTSGTAY